MRANLSDIQSENSNTRGNFIPIFRTILLNEYFSKRINKMIVSL